MSGNINVLRVALRRRAELLIEIEKINTFLSVWESMGGDLPVSILPHEAEKTHADETGIISISQPQQMPERPEDFSS